MEAGCAEAVIIAGILHDTVEDTDLTLEFIRERFGGPLSPISSTAVQRTKHCGGAPVRRNGLRR